MTGLVDWATGRARMIIAFVVLSLGVGTTAFLTLPKEGEPDIQIPALSVTVVFPGISAEDSERLLIRPLEAELQDIDGIKTMSSTAAENYAGVFMEFEFGWDKTATLAEVRDKVDQAQSEFPEGYEEPLIDEINFSEFPILVVALSGDLSERTLLREAKELQDRLEALPAVLEAELAGDREEMLEVLIDPLKLEAYNVTASELINVVVNNNQLIAAGEVRTGDGAFSVKIPSSFDAPQDVYDLPVKVNGDRTVTLGDLAEIRLTFDDAEGTARFNGDKTIALQVVKRKGFNIIDTVAEIRESVAAAQAAWPEDLQQAVQVDFSMDESINVRNMVNQLQGSVLTAIALVMVVVLGALGTRSALLVGFAIPTSFLLCFAFLALMDVAISNMVMFGLILAVGMLVDGAIVVVEYADKRIQSGIGPMRAYGEAAKRMFWPIVASTATTLCAFLPMLFWPGVPGEFMSMLPITLIFVLSASLVVALIYLPVIGGVAGRLSRALGHISDTLRRLPWPLRAGLFAGATLLAWTGAMQALNPAYLPGLVAPGAAGMMAMLPGMAIMLGGLMAMSVTLGALTIHRKPRRIRAGYRRTLFGRFIALIAGNPVMPLVTIGAVSAGVVITFMTYAENNLGTEFFVETETERAIAYVRARGNLSLEEKDALVREAEARVMAVPGVDAVFAFAGNGGLNQNNGGATAPLDTIGQIQIELADWETRRKGDLIVQDILADIRRIPGIQADLLEQARGPAQGKPVDLRLKSNDWQALQEAAASMRARFDRTPGLTDVEDTRPLPGIDWQIDVDVEQAGRYGANVAAVGAMVQLVTRGLILDTMRIDSSDDEIDIRVRFPEAERVLSTLDALKVRTENGLVPLSNFITRTPVPKLAQINRVDQSRYFDVKADVAPGLLKLSDAAGAPLAMARPLADGAEGGSLTLPGGDGAELVALLGGTTRAVLERALAEGGVGTTVVNANERIAAFTDWLEAEQPLPAQVSYEWAGDTEEQAESQAFLSKAFIGALGLMFVILLAQFNSFYNAVLVLLAVVLSTTGVLVGMMVMNQPFSVIMTGTGIVALAGIVVNNNIVLIDTYQDYARHMPRREAIIRTAEDRIRPVLLTTITTMAGLTPMMFGISLDFFAGGYTIDAPSALWWKQLATAVVFGLGIATLLTLVFTPSLLALRYWAAAGAYGTARGLAAVLLGQRSRVARDIALGRATRHLRGPLILWGETPDLPTAPFEAPAPAPAPIPARIEPETRDSDTPPAPTPLRAAE
ncbi:acriflavine resistance protein B [Maritimibacter sp. 55A14]|uniref:efflux RND transporter permease subunit n=1 Tax=Maritimibacter sp. 55A14 TaxID=2174844 RepID=UPI000D608646|nr:efflux RND transporter permease subunit [Maritimibacter sp. 55A14]PWE33904.1 acriflavine resistance protein B [Maritimibacter sp. 55A14]